MKDRNLLSLLGFTALLSMSMGYVFAQGLTPQGPSPDELVQEELAVTDLGPHFECMEGMIFKMSYFEIDPHFIGPQHDHQGRPGLFYILDGSVVEHQGGTSSEYRAGEGLVENADFLTEEHQLTNPSDSKATVIYAQIVPADD